MSKEIFFQGTPPKKETPREEQLELEFHYDKEFFEKAKGLIKERYFEEKKSPRFAFYDLYDGLRKDGDYREREKYFALFMKEMFSVDNEPALVEILSREKGEMVRNEMRESHAQIEESEFSTEQRKRMIEEAKRRSRGLPKG